ncbi:hypothetical protein ACFWZ5_44260, partial [Streptomyces sp. NPDC059003]
MASKAKRTAHEIAARKRALARALELNADRIKREQELTALAADFLETRELQADVHGQLEQQIAVLRQEAARAGERLRRRGAAVIAVMTARGEGAGRIAGRLGLGVGEVRQLRDEAAAREQQDTEDQGDEGVRGRLAAGTGVRAAGPGTTGGTTGTAGGAGGAAGGAGGAAGTAGGAAVLPPGQHRPGAASPGAAGVPGAAGRDGAGG